MNPLIENVYTKEELIALLRNDDEEGTKASYVKLTMTLMHKMLGEDNDAFCFSTEEIEELKTYKKTEALDMLLRLAASTSFSLKNGLIKQVERAIIDSKSEDYSYVKEEYLDNMLFYFITGNEEEYQKRCEHTGLSFKDMTDELSKKPVKEICKTIFGTSRINLKEENVKEVLSQLTIDEDSKQAYLHSSIKQLLDCKAKSSLIKVIFDFVEDKEKLFNAVKTMINADYRKEDKTKDFATLESAYIESKVNMESYLSDENKPEKKRL